MTVPRTKHGHLGKRPFVPDDRDLKAVDFFDRAALPTAPEQFGHGLMFASGENLDLDWDMNGNGPDDTVAPGFQGAGDCVFACAAHTTRVANHLAGKPVRISGKESISDYSACTGYVIGDDSTDQGTDMRAAMVYRRKTGILDAEGDRHKIGAFLSISTTVDALMEAAYVFDAVEVGFQFQRAQERQFTTGVWDYVASSPIEDGHAIPIFGRSSKGKGIVSWATHLYCTDSFIDNLVDEAWAIVYPDSLNASGVNDRGLNLDALNAALKDLPVA